MSVLLVIWIAIVTVFIFAIIFGMLSYKRKSSDVDLNTWTSNYLQGLSVAMVGTGITAILFTLLVGTVQNTAVFNELKAQLIRNMSSSDNATVLNAVTELSWRGWLSDGSMRGQFIVNANLEGANLSGADLRGVILVGANLKRVNFTDAVFDLDTILPDGTRWTPNIDMTRFINPDHPNFWRSSNDKSPAYAAPIGN